MSDKDSDHRDRRQSRGPSRRDFIKLAAGSLGGTLLAGLAVGCGDDDSFPPASGGSPTPGPGTAPPLPNGYVFYRVLTPGSSSPFGTLATLGGGVTNNDSAILFQGQDASGAIGLYQINMQYNGTSAPGISSVALQIITGQILFGKSVDRIHSAAINNKGIFSSFAVVIGSNGDTPTVLVNRDQEGIEPLVKHLDPTPNSGTFGAQFGDLAINDDNDLLLVADYYTESPQSADLAQGLFLLEGSFSSDRGTLITQTGDMVADTAETAARFGICDLDNGGNFVAQVFADTSVAGNSSALLGRAAGPLPMRSGVIKGAASDASVAARLVAGMPGRKRAAFGQVLGNVILGPRITNDVYTAVVHPTEDSMILYYNGTSIAQTGGQSPSGETIMGIGPASVAPNGLAHFLEIVGNGMELVVSNGVEQKTILKYGDTLANSNAQIRAIVHGYHSKQSDSMSRIVFVGEFDDSTQSVVVGIPV
jgi:hypothetical protein